MGNPMRIGHPLEDRLKAPASDILEAIHRAFRSVMNVKGQLAELYLYRKLQELEERGIISNLDWLDEDDKPDFFLEYKGKRLSIECKNVRDEIYKSDRKDQYKKGWYKVETQKTRSGRDPVTGEQTRAYRVNRFHILAACLFNQTGEWQYLFCASRDLLRHPKLPDRLATFQPVPPTPQESWTDDLQAVLDKAIA